MHSAVISAPRYAPAAAALLVALLTILVYWPGLTGGFIFDDISAIVDNSRVHATSFAMEQFKRAATSFDPGGAIGSRPLSMMSFAANHVLGELDPWGYKLAGVLFHAANAVLVFVVLRSLLKTFRTRSAASGATSVSIVLAALWAVHPLQVSTVLYVVQRMEVLSLTFQLIAILLYMLGRQRQITGRRGLAFIVGAIPAMAFGIASKETAILVPAYTLALELTVLRFSASEPKTSTNLRRLYVAGAAIAVLAFLILFVPQYWSDGYQFRTFGSSERLLTQLRVLVLYVGQIVAPLPSNMPFYYDDFYVSRGFLNPVSTIACAVLLATWLFSAVTLRKRMPLFSLGTLWFFAAHALTSNIVPLELVFEHRNYFAILGVLLAAYDLLRRLPIFKSRATAYSSVAAALLAASALTGIRSAIWGDELLLATELADLNPQSERASTALGAAYLRMTDGHQGSPFYDFAISEFKRGAQLETASIFSDQGLIIAAASAGRPVDDALWQRLISRLRSDPITPETTSAMFALLQARYNGMPLDDARLVEAFLVMFDRVTFPPYSYAYFGDYVLKHTPQEAVARAAFIRAIERSESNSDYAEQVIHVLRSEGYEDIALDAACHGLLLNIVDMDRLGLSATDCSSR